MAEASALAELLHEPGDIIEGVEAIALPFSEQDPLLNSSTKQQLGGRAALEPALIDSQSNNNRATAALPARATSLADKP